MKIALRGLPLFCFLSVRRMPSSAVLSKEEGEC